MSGVDIICVGSDAEECGDDCPANYEVPSTSVAGIKSRIRSAVELVGYRTMDNVMDTIVRKARLPNSIARVCPPPMCSLLQPIPPEASLKLRMAAAIMIGLEPLLDQWTKDGGSFESLTDLYLRWLHSYVNP